MSSPFFSFDHSVQVSVIGPDQDKEKDACQGKDKKQDKGQTARRIAYDPCTHNIFSEYTNATSTQLVSPETKDWDRDLIRSLGFPEDIFMPLSMPGTFVGRFTKEIEEEVGFGCDVILPDQYRVP